MDSRGHTQARQQIILHNVHTHVHVPVRHPQAYVNLPVNNTVAPVVFFTVLAC